MRQSATITSSPHHLIGATQKRQRKAEAARLDGLGLLISSSNLIGRWIGWLGALENLRNTLDT
jgi:hypothetical protein